MYVCMYICMYLYQVWDVLLPEEQSTDKTKKEEEEEEEELGGTGSSRPGSRWTGGAMGEHVNFQPAHFVGSISNILSKFPEGLQIHRVSETTSK